MQISREIIHPEIAEISVFPDKDETAKSAAKKVIETVRLNPFVSITYATVGIL